MKNLIIVLGITTCIAGYATPAAAECYSRDECRILERLEREQAEYDRRTDRLQREWELDRQRIDNDRYFERRDPTICQPGEDCRRTLWRSRR